MQYVITDEFAANSLAREIRRGVRFDCRAIFCEDCDGYHVRYDANKVRIDQSHRRVLELVAQGFRDTEIATEVGITKTQVDHCLRRLMRRLNALSRSNLVAIAVALGIINVTNVVPDIKRID